MFFSGKRPAHLGAKQGKLAPPSKKPNSVSSQAEANHPAYIAPLQLKNVADWQALADKIAKLSGARIITRQPDYLHVEFKSALLGFVDDVELLLDGKQVHVRSASRLGYSDLGVNRKRVEQLRQLVA
ncbi:MAG: hypothetical protein RL748_4532 [Pseudomonadota bacterium]|jgi:uncharacterized protein (DUF1499 family)